MSIPLHLLAANGMCEKMKKAIAEGANPNEGETAPIHAAAMLGEVIALKLLLDSNVEIDYTNHAKASHCAGYTALMYATIRNHADAAKFLLHKGASVNLKSIEGTTALHVAAARCRNCVILQHLLAENADVHARDNDGMTPLNIASSNGFLEAAEFLLEYGADVNTVDSRKLETPLMHAVVGSHETVVDMLLRRGASISMCNCYGSNALVYACSNGNDNIVRSLLAQGAFVNDKSYKTNPLFIAADRGHISVVKELLKSNANVNALTSDDNVTSLYVAAKKGHLEVVEALIEYHADVDFIPNTGLMFSPLMLAASGGHVPVMETLINVGGADVDLPMPISGFTALHIAVMEGRGEAVKMLLRCFAKLDATTTAAGDTPLILASRGGDVDIVDMLLLRGGDAFTQQANFEGNFPLLVAAQRGGDPVVVKLLLEAQADVNQVNILNQTNALFHALKEHRLSVAAMLLNCGSTFHVGDFDGIPLFKCAVHIDSHILVKLMLKSSTDDVNRLDAKGESALYFAAKKGRYRMVKLLLRYNADPNQIGHPDGTSPLLVSSFNCHRFIVQALLNAQADVNQVQLNGENALHMVAKGPMIGRPIDVVQILLEHGCSVDQKREDGSTPLDVARLFPDSHIHHILQRNEDFRVVARDGSFETFSDFFLKNLEKGDIPVPIAQWVSIMATPYIEQIFYWASDVYDDCSNCFLLFYQEKVTFGEDEAPSEILADWRTVVNDGTAGVRKIITSYLVPKWKTRRAVHQLLAFGLLEIELTPEELSYAVFSSQSAREFFNCTKNKFEKSRRKIHKARTLAQENTGHSDPLTLPPNYVLGHSAEETGDLQHPEASVFAKPAGETGDLQISEDDVFGNPGKETGEPPRKRSIFAFPKSNINKVVSARNK